MRVVTKVEERQEVVPWRRYLRRTRSIKEHTQPVVLAAERAIRREASGGGH